MSRICRRDGKLLVEIPVKGVQPEVAAAYADLFSKGVLSASEEMDEGYEICLVGEDGKAYGAVAPPKRPVQKKCISEINLFDKEIIGYETYREIIEELKCVEGIQVFRTAYSYAGRELYGIWLEPQYQGYLSMTKRLSRCPSEIINARHHANEVSSTNAALLLLRLLFYRKDRFQRLIHSGAIPLMHPGSQRDQLGFRFHAPLYNPGQRLDFLRRIIRLF